MTKFTNGPWRVEKIDCFNMWPFVQRREEGGFVVKGLSKEKAMYDAHLISAAPEMYEALEGLLEMYVQMVNSGDCGNWDPEKEKEVIEARSALAKARGEAS